MKQYIKPNVEVLKTLPCALLAGSGKEDDQDVGFGAKKHYGWSFTDAGDDDDDDAWPRAHSAWDKW